LMGFSRVKRLSFFIVGIQIKKGKFEVSPFNKKLIIRMFAPPNVCNRSDAIGHSLRSL
jgi:hypothetical protein